MWIRKELKSKGKQAFKANYWRAVIVSLILSAIIGGGAGISGGYLGSSAGNSMNNINEIIETNQAEFSDKLDAALEEHVGNIEDLSADADIEEIESVLNDFAENEADKDQKKVILLVISVIAGVLSICFLLAFAINVFLINPLTVGCNNFFISNSNDSSTNIGAIERGFTPKYFGNVKTMLLKDVFLVLWSMLFIIPGIIKSYSYRMVPYILADDPDVGCREAITRSREMMNGNKWRAFVLDLSFIGWYILSALTFGILNIFFVGPYKYATDAELYGALKNNSNN